MPTPRSTLTALLTLACLSAGARAQDESRFREVEPGVEDLGQGAVSTLFRPVDLRAPTDFSRVYEIIGTDKFARRAGAVTAVFDRGVYAGDGAALIPAGTVFYIGTLPVDLGRPGLLDHQSPWVSAAPAESLDTLANATPTPDTPTAQRLDLRVGAAPPPPAPAAANDNTIWTSEPYRQRRMGELLRGVAWRVRAASAPQGQDPADARRD